MSPFLRALLRKMSANESATTAPGTPTRRAPMRRAPATRAATEIAPGDCRTWAPRCAARARSMESGCWAFPLRRIASWAKSPAPSPALVVVLKVEGGDRSDRYRRRRAGAQRRARRSWRTGSRSSSCVRTPSRSTARIRELAGDRGRRRGQWRREEGAPPLALASLEVSVARADRVLAGAEVVAVHRDAHRTAGLACHSAPAALTMASSPSTSARRFTCSDPGNDEHLHGRRDLAPFGGRCATARRSDRRPLVQEPTKTTSISIFL